MVGSNAVASPVTVDAIRAVTDNLPNSGALTDITDVTDNLPDSGVLTSISDETDKIDDAATDGLAGTSDSTAYRIHETERHLHSYSRAYETASAPNGEVHVADSIGSGSGAFQIDAGNDDWGSWVQCVGSGDTSQMFDFHRISVEAVEREATYFLQFAFGASGAAAITASTYSDFIYIPETNKKEPAPITIQTRRQVAGTKAWARTKCPGQNTATFDFYHEMHFYEG